MIELTFKEHSVGMGGTSAKVSFDNGYGASVITGGMFYTSDSHPFELAVLKGGKLCYDTPITTDVLGHLTEDAVQDLLLQIKELPSDA